MNTNPQLCMAVLFSITCSFTGAAAAADLTITVHADDVVVNGQRFDDADTLERYVSAQTPRTIRLQACGAAALPVWKFLVYHLRRLPLEPAVIGASDPACAPDARLTRVSLTQVTPLLRDASDPAVDRFWNGMMP